MNNMNGWAAKSRTGGGGLSSITSGAVKGCGKKGKEGTVSPQPKKILNGPVSDKVVQPSKKAEQSR